MIQSIDKFRNRINCILTALICISVSVSASIDASIDYEIEGNGFHRTVRYRVETGNFFKDNCYVALRLSPDPTLYVDVDELADLRRRGKIAACSDGEIDVELFAHKAGGQNITLCSPLRESGTVLDLPLHQRYQLPRDDQRFVDVTLAQPVLLLGCKDRIKEYPVSKLDLCSPCVDLSVKWRQIPYKMRTKDYVWMIPVGDLADLNYVTWVTLFTAWFGTFVILRTLWQSWRDNPDRKDRSKKLQ